MCEIRADECGVMDMSVLVKGMEMPKNCLACKLRGDGSDSRHTWDCPFTAFAYTREAGEAGRLDECPLVEVPVPHGNLIDIDSKITVAIKYGLKVTTVRGLLNDKAVRLPRTIIEAEVTE